MKSKIGLLATSRKKQSKPDRVIDFYSSPLFKKSAEYALLNYDRFYFYNAKDGLLLPDQMMSPYDVSIKTFRVEEKRLWAEKVVHQLHQYEIPGTIDLYLHGGQVYRRYLQPQLHRYGYTFEVPLEGLGIGQQLKWYDEHINKYY
ncbi:DUF6884 domain-containing protein [Tuberibacillus sp. Marseille-P3662]|uniref:DUF6884 domain-containing protein n=1 Tax=Tuberibacillus sp. Marseille-P3662 TaxID=1965358 RepID=UPI000A1CEC48|nr:DUF6884 domain-containing protein [Tuberibacillus sp. Marseille-P3662]